MMLRTHTFLEKYRTRYIGLADGNPRSRRRGLRRKRRLLPGLCAGLRSTVALSKNERAGGEGFVAIRGSGDVCEQRR